ncbi:MAG: metallophosphoesterase, partial [Clostridia bacterium]|nr:metallophosphoesterase [Clostridia bacterium]
VDLNAIGQLPGHKAILRGNHDYWWNGITQVRSALPEGMQAVQNDCLVYDQVVVCGSRGWTPMPAEGSLSADDQKIYDREVMRMGLSLERGAKASQGRPIIVMMHYPPMNEKWEPSPFTQLFEQYGVKQVIYGHLHGGSVRGAYNGELNGIGYQLTSCDGLGFRLWQCPQLNI